MQVIHDVGSRPIKAWVGTKEKLWELEGAAIPFKVPDIEDAALEQAKNIARLPFIHQNGVALMPDVHAGKGSTVGTVIATDKAVIPAAVAIATTMAVRVTPVRVATQATVRPTDT
jgi:tRNA-splicing ligase RtcB